MRPTATFMTATLLWACSPTVVPAPGTDAPDIVAGIDAEVDAALDTGEAEEVSEDTGEALPDAGPDADVGHDDVPVDISEDLAEEDVQVDAPAPKGEVTLSTVDVIAMGACAPVEVELSVTTDDDVTFTLTSVGGEFFQDEDCAVQGASLVVAEASATLWFRPSQAGEVLLKAEAAEWVTGEAVVDVSADTYAFDERPEEVVVVYNTNAGGALAIASHYAEKRGIGAERLCPVQMPRGLFATPTHLLAARQSVLDCLCKLSGDEAGPACVPSNTGAIVPASKVTHLALIRGIPARMTGTPWPSDNEEPSLDFYLSHLLANDADIFAEGTKGSINFNYKSLGILNDLSPKLEPATHKFFAIGRVEAITVARTLALIDRTLASEAQGFEGNIVSEAVYSAWSTNNPGRYLTSTFDDVCQDYLFYEPFVFGAPESSWNTGLCRWGTTGTSVDGAWDGMMPGFSKTTVPNPINVTWFTGNNPRANKNPAPENNHSAFTNYSTMKKWRKTAESCAAECDDLVGIEAQQACEDSSTDYFRVLNTDCVGVAPGFMGQQVRSYPVGYYGFFPQGWGRGGGGGTESTPPEIRSGGAFQNDDFADDYYLHFGAADHANLNADLCTNTEGEEESCNERVAVNLMHTLHLGEPITVNGTEEITVKYRYRNQGGPQAHIRLHLCANSCEVNLKDTENTWPTHPVNEAQLAWAEASHTLVINEADTPTINKLRIWIDGRFARFINGFFDLDAVEIRRTSTGELLSVGDIYSFSDTKLRKNGSGASAADVIDRMSGIAYWGSSSHHLTGGWAYSPTTSVARNVFGGRTLGEALVKPTAKSGIAYGDPLYRGYAVKITNGETRAMPVPWVYDIWADSSPEASTLYLNVLQGMNHTHRVAWTLDHCTEHPIESCAESWSTLLKGVGAVRGHPLSNGMLPEAKTYLRLRAWRDGQPEKHISSYARVHLHGDDWELPAECDADLDGDGVVEAADVATLKPFRICDEGKLACDVNDDGVVEIKDVGWIVAAIGSSDLTYDTNGDGVVDQADADLALESLCGMTWKGGPPEETPYDLNGDGAVDDADLDVAQAAEGFDNCPCTTSAFACNLL